TPQLLYLIKFCESFRLAIPSPPPPAPSLVLQGNKLVMEWAGKKLAEADAPKDDTSPNSSSSSADDYWPSSVQNEGKQSGYFAAGVAYGWAQHQTMVGTAIKMPWEVTGTHHDPNDEVAFAQGAAWGLMLASTRDQAQALAMAWEAGWGQGYGRSIPGRISGATVATQMTADAIMVEVHILEARAAAGASAAGLLFKKYGGGSTSGAPKEPEKSDYRGRYNQDRIKQGKKPLPSEYDAHHRIPQEYRNHPEFKDLDFDAPSNIRGVKGNRALWAGKARADYHGEITMWWKQFREKFPNARRSQIETFAADIDKAYQRFYFR
ncbi:hypothetical protein, partial [Microcoleus sp. herbarium12]|uniref:hypothetical protein n=1 Tax=Microcoleus sp. herbarium12 TaxID=3055437 RepID=UPI002FD6EBE8